MSGIESDPLAPLRASPLWQAVFKLDWADQMFVHAVTVANEFIESGKFGYRKEIDKDGEQLILFCERLPKDIPLAVGAGIHSLRSALDTAVSSLMEGMTKKPGTRVNFPFHETEKNFRADFEPRISYCGGCKFPREKEPKLKHLADQLPELVDLLLHTFKPWRDGNIGLWSLNKLDNIQKHQMLLLVTSAVSGGVDFYDPARPLVSFHANEWIIPPGGQAVVAESRDMIVETSERRIGLKFSLPRELPYGGEPLFDVLGDLYKLVRSILITLHARFVGHEALS